MRLACDVDGVLCDWNSAFLKVLIETSGRDCGPILGQHEIFIPESWDWPRDLGYTNDEVRAAWKTVSERSGWWEYLAPMPGAHEFLATLHNRCEEDPEWEAVFLTSRRRSTPFIKQQTELWLARNGFGGADGDPAFSPYPTVLVGAEHKGDVCQALRLDALIDDKPSHLHEAAACCGPKFKPFLFTTGHNAASLVPPQTTLLYTLHEFWEGR
jgi:hypothetical protein